MICADICDKFGSLRSFTEQLRLRLLLKPLGYEADLATLRERCAGEAAALDAVADFLAPGAGVGSRVALVVGGAGEGKSTIASKAVESLGVTALHLCKRADARRQDSLAVARSLVYQLALHHCEARPVVLRALLGEVSSGQGGGEEAVAPDDEDAVGRLLLEAVRAAPGALLLIEYPRCGLNPGLAVRC